MSKESLPNDILHDMLKGKDYKKPTDSPQSQQKAYKVPTAGTQKAYRVRIPENWWKLMTKHFAKQGKRPSEGLREIIRDYLERHGEGD